MPMVEDLSTFFNVDEFGVQAVLDGARAVTGIFDNGHRQALGAIGVQDPSFTAPSADLATAVQGSALRIDGIEGVGRYTVRDIQPDGTGVTTLLLTKAA